ncbi:hypothetical protein [Anabaena sp. CCY 9402-a]|uniref:hypothetical protein n=1 Tax=Anabaena sp. CCY 9402-a TaxID=3103867 RepID=UPI0039C5AC33
MNLQIQELPNSKRSTGLGGTPSPRTIQENSTPGNNDSLIAKGWQREQYIGIAILFISLIAAIGFFSRRFEYALLFALALSIALMILLLNV